MWKEVATVYHLDRWREHHQTGREFCAANIYPDDENDSTQEGNGRHLKSNNRERQKGAQEGTLALLVETIKETVDIDTNKVQEETWKERNLFLQEQRAAQKLSTLSGMLARNAAEIQEILQRRREYHVQGLDAADIGRTLANCKKKAVIEEQMNDLEFEIIKDIH
ncbi:hypothetical protein PR003_g11775 [Phytophthora rubi]|uniref:Uncharacterized protein n=2 Tax=Phytophthora TaxID=4783 RepID=A0A6A4FA62_9STRA|nr:hypothetical protein PR002_g6432 [Phytophthora rubi]KAE9043134.1 hypothetical protein PR001_g5914 [Phytophthora rubi]KAE9337902.1 hypothetical protein PR003_g11775 [Phytophthora rubi]